MGNCFFNASKLTVAEFVFTRFFNQFVFTFFINSSLAFQEQQETIKTSEIQHFTRLPTPLVMLFLFTT